MHEADFIAAALPLFEEGEIEVLEWSFDTISAKEHEPEWLPVLLDEYSRKGRLLGHGVRYSLLSGDFSKKQERWLKQLADEMKRYTYRHITEHFGFMTSDDFHKGAPLPVPFNEQSLAIGQDRLKRIQQAAGIPVGVENLAFAFSAEQAKEQGLFLEKLIEPVNGFLILDLHNVWCQAINFKIDVYTLLNSYPLHKVKEIHISGGSWSTVSSSGNPVRRDTHDEAVPPEVLQLLKEILHKCPYAEAVIFERLGNTLLTTDEQVQFIQDFKTIKRIVSDVYPDDPTPLEIIQRSLPELTLPDRPVTDKLLKQQQQLIIDLLLKNNSILETIANMKQHKELQENGWNTHLWTPNMIETAVQLLKKWNG
jgi:uncharacterized protein (UPF0276 family)